MLNGDRSLSIPRSHHRLSTNYRPVSPIESRNMDSLTQIRIDVDVVIHQDKPSQWRARLQLWNSQREQTGRNQASRARGSSAISSRRTSLAASGSGRPSSNTGTSQLSSTMSFQTKASQVTAVTSFMESETDKRSNVSIDASTFEPPKQPLLVLFLRPRRGALPSKQHLSLMRIPSMSNDSNFYEALLISSQLQWARS
jgi:hypothetical protein